MGNDLCRNYPILLCALQKQPQVAREQVTKAVFQYNVNYKTQGWARVLAQGP